MSDHWNKVYASRGRDELSWFEAEPAVSLELFELLGVTSAERVLDVGAGESLLVDRLAARGFTDLTVLDLSSRALADVASRPGLERVNVIEDDVTTWEPTRRYDVWHDRAVLHFIEPSRVGLYTQTLHRALAPHAKVVIGVFAPDGPETCSGLTVTRYDAPALARVLAEGFDVVSERRTSHLTPGGTGQSFQWVAAVRKPRAS